MRIDGDTCCAMVKHRHRTASPSKAQKPSILKRPAKNVTLSWKTIRKLEAIADYRLSQGEPRPTRSWMLEQGVDLFCRAMEQRYPAMRAILSDIEATYERAAGNPRLGSGHAEASSISPLQHIVPGRALRLAEAPVRGTSCDLKEVDVLEAAQQLRVSVPE